jgi:hypothetical protein
MRTFEYTFNLGAAATVTGTVQESDLSPQRKGFKLLRLGTASDGAGVDASIVMGDVYPDLQALEWNLSRSRRGQPADLMDLIDLTLGTTFRNGSP